MALIPHKITALAESDAQGTDGKNIVAGAVVSLFDEDNNAVTLFDNDAGANGSTTKTTDATGQVVVYVTPGEYEEQVNGGTRRKVSIFGNSTANYATTAELAATRPTQTGQMAVNRERANAQYVLAASGYAAKVGDITADNGRVWQLVSGNYNLSLTVNIPSDFPTLQSSFDYYLPKLRLVDGAKITINIESGHQITEGLLLTFKDCTNYIITSEDPIVNLAPTFIGKQTSSDVFEQNSLLAFSRTIAPDIDVLFDMGDMYGCGLVYSDQSQGNIGAGKGVVNSGAFGLYVKNQSRVNAVQCNFSGAGWGNRVTTNSFLQAPQCNMSGCKNETYLITNSSANLDVSRGSLVYITGAVGAETNLTNSAGRGLAVRRSFCSATSVNVSGSATQGLIVSAGSNVAFNASIADNCNDGVFINGSSVDAESSSAKNCSNYGMLADDGSSLNARDTDVSGYGFRGIFSNAASKVNARNARARLDIEADSITDFLVGIGSTMNASGTIGGTNQTANIVSANGIIFK